MKGKWDSSAANHTLPYKAREPPAIDRATHDDDGDLDGASEEQGNHCCSIRRIVTCLCH